MYVEEELMLTKCCNAETITICDEDPWYICSNCSITVQIVKDESEDRGEDLLLGIVKD
jgi:hypothetical protein